MTRDTFTKPAQAKIDLAAVWRQPSLQSVTIVIFFFLDGDPLVVSPVFSAAGGFCWPCSGSWNTRHSPFRGGF